MFWVFNFDSCKKQGRFVCWQIQLPTGAVYSTLTLAPPWWSVSALTLTLHLHHQRDRGRDSTHHWPSLSNATILTTSPVIIIANQWVILEVTWEIRKNADSAPNCSDCDKSCQFPLVPLVLSSQLSSSSEFIYHCQKIPDLDFLKPADVCL